MSADLHSDFVTTGPKGVDGAVGVPDAKWFVAIVNPKHEKSSAEKLQEAGFEVFVATQRELHVWNNGRRKMVDRVVIPGMVFVKCCEQERRRIVTLSYILRFMVNRTVDSGSLNKPAATIPDDQMARLKFMLGQTDVPVDFVPTLFNVKDTVRVVRGSFMGLTGNIMQHSDGTHTLLVSLSILGGATVRIEPHDVEKL